MAGSPQLFGDIQLFVKCFSLTFRVFLLLLHGPDAGAAGPALCAVPRAAAPPLLLEVPHGEDEPDDQADYK